MAKYLEPFSTTTDLFNNAILEADLTRFINVTILVDNKGKKLVNVSKASEILKHRTGDDVIIVLNEGIFDVLTDEQRLIVIDDALSQISYDSEHEKLTIIKPDLNLFSMVLIKYGTDKCLELDSTIKLLYSQDKDKKSQEDKE